MAALLVVRKCHTQLHTIYRSISAPSVVGSSGGETTSTGESRQTGGSLGLSTLVVIAIPLSGSATNWPHCWPANSGPLRLESDRKADLPDLSDGWAPSILSEPLAARRERAAHIGWASTGLVCLHVTGRAASCK